MYMHLLHADGTVSDGCDYTTNENGDISIDNPPFQPDKGDVWVEGVEPEDAQPFRPQSTKDKLLGVFESQPIEFQLKYADAFALAKHYGDKGDLEKVIAIISAVPLDPGEETVKDELLEQVPAEQKVD